MFSRWSACPLTSLLARLPSQCALCREWPSQPLCEACAARFAPATLRCATCALPVPEGVARCGECVRHPPPLDACIAACDYAWPWPDLVAEFKFRGEAGWAGPLAALLRELRPAAALLAAGDVASGRVVPFAEAPSGQSYWLIAPLPQWRQKKVRSLVAALTA